MKLIVPAPQLAPLHALAVAMIAHLRLGASLAASATRCGLTRQGAVAVLRRAGLPTVRMLQFPLDERPGPLARRPPRAAQVAAAQRLLAHPYAHHVTPRQRMVVLLRAGGCSLGQIGASLRISASGARQLLVAAACRLAHLAATGGRRAPRQRRQSPAPPPAPAISEDPGMVAPLDPRLAAVMATIDLDDLLTHPEP